MIFFRLMLYGLLLYLPFLMVWDGYFHSGVLLEERTLWYQNFDDQPQFNLDQEVTFFPSFKRRYYQSDRLLAYFDERGEVKHKVFIDNQSLVSARNNAYLLFRKFGDLIHLIDSSGKKRWSYSTFSYGSLSPLNNNVLFITTDNSMISMIDRNQNQILEAIYVGTMITDFTFCPYNDSLVIGTMDSILYRFDSSGERTFEEQLMESRFNYIKSLACSASGNWIALLNGLKPEQLTLIDQNGILLWQKNTGVERRTKVGLGIDEKNGFIYDQRGDHLAMISLAEGTLIRKIPLDPKFKIRYSLFSSDEQLFLVGDSGEQQRVTLYDLEGNIKWTKSFKHSSLQYVEVKSENGFVYLLIILEGSIYNYRLNQV